MKKNSIIFFTVILSVILLTSCNVSEGKKQENTDTKYVKTEMMKTMSETEFYKKNKAELTPVSGWEPIYFSKDKLILSNVSSLIMFRNQKGKYKINKILNLEMYDLNHSQAEGATQILPSNNGEQILMYNSYDTENAVLSENDEDLKSWVANFVTGTMKRYQGNDLQKIAKKEKGSFFSCQYTCKPTEVPKKYHQFSRGKFDITAFSTAYNDEILVLTTKNGDHNMLSLEIERYTYSAKKSKKLYKFTE